MTEMKAFWRNKEKEYTDAFNCVMLEAKAASLGVTWSLTLAFEPQLLAVWALEAHLASRRLRVVTCTLGVSMVFSPNKVNRMKNK